MRPLVVFGEDWGRHPSSTQHLIARVAASHDVIWINSIGLRRPRLSLKDLKRVFIKLGIAGVHEAEFKAALPERMSILSPSAISWPGNALAALFNKFSVSRQINKELKRRGLGNPVFWVSLPTALDIIQAYATAPVIYYCGDDFGALEGVDHCPVQKKEQALIARADVVFAASETLATRFPAQKTKLLLHGVDLMLFQTSCARPADMPQGKVVGFYGSLASWIDVEAIVRTAQLMPDWTFFLIGEERSDMSLLRTCPNIFLTGQKHHSALPSYVQHWTVSLLPFRNIPQITACNPLKLREYMSVGTPIVSPYFEAIAPYKDLIEVTPYGNYCSAILRACEDKDRNILRRKAVVQESWDQRASTAMRILEDLSHG